MAFSPRQRNEIYVNITTQVIALAPITSTSLGEVTDNFSFAVASEIYGLYYEQQNALQLLSLDSTSGSDLDAVVSEYPNLAPRFAAVKATGVETVFDTAITKTQTDVDVGGAAAGDGFINVIDTSAFPASGSVLVGVRGSATFETVAYASKTPTQFVLVGLLGFNHVAGEDVVLTTVGDRNFPGPFTFRTNPTATQAAKTYVSTSALVIYDGEESGQCNIEASNAGTVGNTPAGTIVEFVGAPPFPTASPINLSDLTNGAGLEGDPDVRQRIRREKQALSSANIDAVTSKLFGTIFNGQRIRFVQLVEDPLPTRPDIMYVDDGSAFLPTPTAITSPIILTASASGGEEHFRIPIDFLPIVTTIAENNVQIFANITVERNAVPITQGDGAGQYRVQPNSGVLKLVDPLVAGESLEITALTYWSGLLGLANKNLYGDRNDRLNFPGVVGLGQWVQPRAPSVIFVDVVGNIILDGSRALDLVVADIKAQILSYIQSLGIGASVIKNRVQALGFVAGVKDFSVTALGGVAPAVDVVVPDGNLSRAGTITLA